MNKKQIASLAGSFFVVACVFSILYFTQSAWFARAAITDNMAGYWKLDEASGTQASDSSGQGGTGTLVNGPTWTAGKKGNGLNFDGVDDKVNIPNSTALNISGKNITIAFWTKLSFSASDSVFVNKSWSASAMTYPYYQYGVEFAGGPQAFDFYFSDASAAMRGPFRMPQASIFDTWYHVAFTYDGANVRGYVNGVQKLVTPETASIQARGNILRLGVDGASKQPLKGVLDEVRIYGRTLTASEIVDLYNDASGAVAPPLCTPNWSCDAWSICSVAGAQTRTCTDTNNCGVTTGKPAENQSCAYTPPVCSPSWSCTGWSLCTNSIQTRICTDTNACGVTASKPAESQSCTSQPSTGAITASLVPSRASCVAPCAVFFDSTGTTADTTARPFHELDYTWNFGDPTSGVWATDGKSKNSAKGGVAAHVFETPGTYTVNLNIKDTNGNTASKQTVITVQAFLGTTYYVSSTGNDNNTGTLTSAPLKTFDKAMTKVATNTRILFKRTESFSTPIGKSLGVAGPGIVGAYANSDGSDDKSKAKPVINFTGTLENSVFTFPPGAPDWRVMDLELIGSGDNSRNFALSGGGDSSQVQSLMLRLNVKNFAGGYITNWTSVNSDEIFLADITFSGIGSPTSPYNTNCMYFAGTRSAILGTTCSDKNPAGRVEHILRVWHARKVVIAHDILMDPMVTKHAIKFHSEVATNPPLSEYNIISDNVLRGEQVTVWIGPQDGGSNEPLKNVVIERNKFLTVPTSGDLLIISGREVTARNNIFIMTGGSKWMSGAKAAQRGVEPSPDHVSFYNNTFYKADDGSEFVGVTINASASNSTVRNNLAFAPNFTGYQKEVLFDQGANSVVSNNILSATNPFVNVAMDDFHLKAGSSGVDAGFAVSVFDDYVGISRPQGNIWDVGAYEYAGTIPPPACTPNWSCTSWSTCSVAGAQTRTCADTNACGVTTNKPAETQFCTYTLPQSTKFTIGDRVTVTADIANLNVRQTPSMSATILGTQVFGALGTVVGGPTYADSTWWWQVNYDTGVDGWSIEDHLEKARILQNGDLIKLSTDPKVYLIENNLKRWIVDGYTFTTLGYKDADIITVTQAELNAFPAGPDLQLVCAPNWSCTAWSTCSGSNQTRTCTDTNACGIATGKPTESQSCTASLLPSSLNAYWKLEEGSGIFISDSSGNNNIGNLTGPVWTSGKIGGGLQFNGINNYVTIPNTPSIDIGGKNISIALWANVTDNTADQVLLAKHWAVTKTNPVYQYAVEYGKSTRTYDFYFGNTSGILRGPFRMNATLNTWQHVVFTYDGANVKGYVNGVLSSTASETGSIQSRAQRITLGIDGALAQAFKGTLDEIMIYGKTLTAAEITSLYNSAPAPVCTPNWSCTVWSSCSNSTQTRTCTDTNACGAATGKPAESQSCINPPATSAITASLVPSRTSCVAPCSIFFDSTGTTANATSRPFHELDYTWSFGDPTSGVWSTTGKNKNIAKGAVAAHVFENPGNYTVDMSVKDALGNSAAQRASIIIQNPDTVFSGTNTICFAKDNLNWNGCPSAVRIVSSNSSIIADITSKIASNKRLLLRRGDSWTVDALMNIYVDGPGIIGAFGSGNKPKLTVSVDILNEFFIEVTGNDWRIQDLSLVGPSGNPETSGLIAIGILDNAVRDLVLRNDISMFPFVGIASSYSVTNDSLAFVENNVYDIGLYGATVTGNRLAFLGNRVERAAGSHVMRVFYSQKGVIEENILHDPSTSNTNGRHSLKLHSDHDISGILPTEKIIISGNDFRGSGQVVNIAPQNTDSPAEIIRDVIFEKNTLRADVLSPVTTGQMLEVIASDVTVRNNIFLGDGNTPYLSNGGFVVIKSDSNITSNRVNVYNNTAYKTEDFKEFVFFRVEGATNVQIRNNVASFPAFIGYQYDYVTGSGNPAVSNNILYTPKVPTACVNAAGATGAGACVNPLFVNPAFGDFRLQASSPAIDAGTNVLTFEDYSGTLRPQGSKWDVGAYEYAGTTPSPTCTPNWSCTSWSTCSVAGAQTRTCTDTNACGVATGKPVETQSCTPPPPPPPVCAPNWSCNAWSSCSISGSQIRTCTDANSCGVNTNKPVETQSCTPPAVVCNPNWICAAWSACSAAGAQTRVCADTNSCGVNTNKPMESQSCVPPDITSPIISQIQISGVSTSTAIISWTTNEAATTLAEYGINTSYGQSTALASSLSLSHIVTLSNLNPNTAYHFRLKSQDSSLNLAQSTDQTFTTQALIVPDTTAPDPIVDISLSDAGQSSVTIRWSSAQDTSGIAGYDLRYGTTTITDLNFNSAMKVRDDLIVGAATTTQEYYISTGLIPQTTYYFAVRSVDTAGNISMTSNIPSITTLDAPVVVSPAPSVDPGTISVPASSGGGSGGGGGGGGGSYSVYQLTDATPPAEPKNSTALPANGQVVLNWENPKDNDFVRVVIKRSTDDYPKTKNDGTTIYEGTLETFTDIGLDNNNAYYYSIFSYDKSNNYSPPVRFLITPKEEITQIDTPSIESTLADSDDDGLPDNLENYYGTDKNNLDTDNDGFSDKEEVDTFHDPINPPGKISPALTNRFKGNILLQVKKHGEAWYVNPIDGKRYYLRDGDAAYMIMRKMGLGITDANLMKIPEAKSVKRGDAKLTQKLKGRILLQVQQHGEAWYVNPIDGKRYYMKDGMSAYDMMRTFGLGITDESLIMLPYGRL